MREEDIINRRDDAEGRALLKGDDVEGRYDAGVGHYRREG